MTDRTDPHTALLDDLIARLDAATRGSQELDAAIIARLVGGTFAQSPFNGAWCVYNGTNRNGQARLWEYARGDAFGEKLWWTTARTEGLTSSVDAALVLVPDGCGCVLGAGRITPSEPLYGAVIFSDLSGRTEIGHGETNVSLALAVCIAALRARKVTP